ncbi:MAG: GNAT family N-acetyltransferase [Dehalococcoidia bacterium]
MDALIRPARGEDLDAVHRLYVEWESEDNTYGLVAPARDDLDSWLDDYFLVASLDGVVVGFARGVARVSEGLAVIPRGERFLEVEDLYVRPKHRNGGIGGQCLDDVLTSARGDGISRTSVASNAHDQQAIVRFYVRHGLKPWGTQFFA